MHLIELEAVNFCQFRHFQHRFMAGLTALIGANGSGKSNLMNAIRFALTGVIPLPGDKDKNICQLAPPEEKSFVRLVFEHGLNTRMEVTRFLRPESTKSRLVITHDPAMPLPVMDNKPTHGDKAINQRIRELLGRDFDMISDMVLVSQEQLFGFLDMVPAERAKSFQRLFRTEAAEGVYQSLGKFLTATPRPAEPLVDQARINLDQSRTALAGWTAAVAQLRTMVAIQAERDYAVQVIGAFEARRGAASLITQERGQLQNLLEALQLAEGLRVRYSDQHQAVYNQLTATQPMSLKARAALINLINYRKMEETRRTIREGRDKDQAALAALQEPPRPANYQPRPARDVTLQDTQRELASLQAVLGRPTLEQVRQMVTRVEQDLQQLVLPMIPENYLPISERERMVSQLGDALTRENEFLRAFDNTGVAECPTCHTPVSTIVDRVAAVRAAMPTRIGEYEKAKAFRQACDQYDTALSQYRAQREILDQSLPYLKDQNEKLGRLPGLQAAFEQAQQVCNDSAFYDAAAQTYHNNRTQLTQAIENWTRQEANIQTLDQPETTEAELQQIISHQSELERSLADLVMSVQTQQREVSRLEGQIGQLRSSLASRENSLAGLIEVTEEQYTKAQADRALLDQELQNRQQSDTHLATAQQAEVYWQQQFTAAVASEEEGNVLRAALGQLTVVRELFHHSSLPRFVAHRNLQRLQQRINDFLTMFQTDYRVQANEGLSFVASFPDGRRQAAERLSGGQKVILALAFRLAVNVMFAENVGFLALDEPTAFVDEHHIRGFEPVLSRLREYSHSRGLQCLVITHERSLAPLFDSVVAL